MTLDKAVAAVFLLISLVYGIAAFNYPLLPFERNMVFLPNTLPMALSIVGVFFALLLIVLPAPAGGEEEDVLGAIDLRNMGQYKVGQALALVASMVVYALILRPVGFVAATTFFLIGTGWILGERKLHIMVPIALAGAVFVWYLVQELLGIFLRPWPWFIA